MNDKRPPVSRFRFWTWPWFWSVLAALVLVGYAVPGIARDVSQDQIIFDCVQLAVAFLSIAVLPMLVCYEVGCIAKIPPRWRPNWFWLLLTGILIGAGWNAYVIWDTAIQAQPLRPLSEVISFLAWSVSLVTLAFCLRALWKFFRWMWVPRRRYWTWLWVWSLTVAAVTLGFTAQTSVFADSWTEDSVILVRQIIGFCLIALVTLMISHLALFGSKNKSRSLKMFFWLAVAGMLAGGGWTALLVWSGTAPGVAVSPMNKLFTVLAGTLVFLLLAAFVRLLVKCLIRLIRWRGLKPCLLALAGLVVLVPLFYAEENWRGHRAWENYRRELAARGEKFDILSFAPPVVPDDQNFAMAPVVATSYESWLDKSGHLNTPPKTNIVNRMALDLWRTNNYFPDNLKIGSWRQASLTDLKPWQDYYRKTTFTNNWSPGGGRENIQTIQLDTNTFPVAPQPQSPTADVLLALSRFDAVIAELRQAGKRPFSRFPLNYQDESPWSLMVPHLYYLKRCAQVLQFQAIAELHAGQTEPALADVKLMLRLEESVHNEPTLYSHGQCLSLVELALQPVWEGLAERRWSETQMKDLSAQLEKLDLVSDLQNALHGERVNGLEYIEMSRKFRVDGSGTMLNAFCPRLMKSLEQGVRYLPGMTDVSDWFADRLKQRKAQEFVMLALGHLTPAGWYDWNKVALAKMYQDRVFPIAQPEKHLISQTATMAAGQFIDEAGQPNKINLKDALVLLFVGSNIQSIQETAQAQNAVDMAIVACALERYHLAQGEYPETLAVLAPEYLKTIPPDVVDGQPLHYRRTREGRFILYSVGWDGKDDGGVIHLGESSHWVGNQRVPYPNDWVWRYPPE